MTARGVVAVTGASGFLGGHLCQALASRGYSTRALVRSRAAALPGVDNVVVDDVANRRTVRDALRGANAVIHLAGRAHVLREHAADPLAEFRRVNVDGTRVVLEEAIAAGVECFAFVSSVKAVCSQSDAVLDETTAPAPDTPYGISKLEAEEMIRSLANRAGIRATILRPPLVYGPGMKANALSLFSAVARGVPLPFGSVRNRRSVVYSGNLVAALATVIDTPAAAGETFFVSDGGDVSTAELARAIGRALGKPARLIGVPTWLFHWAGAAGDVLSGVARMPLTSTSVESLLGSLAVDASRITRVTQFRPPYSTEQGLDATSQWYRDRRAST